MALEALLIAALNAAFLAVFGLTLRDYLRRRDRVSLAVVLVFGSLEVVLASSAVSTIAPPLRPIVKLVSLIAFMAQPLLVLWLVHHFRPVPRAALGTAAAVFVGLTGYLIASSAAGARITSAPALALLLVVFLGYYVLLELAAALSFAAAARRRAGASRLRLATASAATGLFGLAVAVLLLGGTLAAGSDSASYVSFVVLAIALLAALGYLVAFAPPRFVRRLSQQTIAYEFIRELNALPDPSPTHGIWSILERTAVRSFGAVSAEVVPDGRSNPSAKAASSAPEPTDVLLTGDTPGPEVHRIEIPLASERASFGMLRVTVAGSPLFVQDDVELVSLLADRAVRSAEREIFVQERENLIAELQAASAAKSDFLAAMSHELRTPLNAIIGFSELLLETDDDAADVAVVRSYADHIHGSGLHLLDLINEILDLAKVEAGRLELKIVAFDVDELLAQVAATMRPLAERKSIAVETALPAGTEMRGDPARIRQVAFNLLSNAIKFTGPGGKVRLEAEADHDEVRISVVDNGPGIAADDIGRIFEAFEQVGGDAEGTGLGLALSRRLAEAHGGRIAVSSVVGKGSWFTVHLPRRTGAKVVEQAVEEAVSATTTRSDAPTVLVIEDDPAAAELLRLHLGGAGFAVTTTASGVEGLAWARQQKPDAIVLDILLPDLDGWEVLQKLKGSPATRSIPVLVASCIDDRPLGLALGAVDYFVKPITREPLLEALGRLTFTTKVRTRTVTALIIDGDPDAVGRYRSVLEPEGFRVLWAADAAAGRDQARSLKPDLILVDVLLGGGDAFDLIAGLKHESATAGIPIWVTTPETLEADDKARLNGNVIGIVQTGDGALEALRTWLRPAGTGPAPGAASA
jgi:signal transduction histidine kinase/DNA-binding response OmpR family regulator